MDNGFDGKLVDKLSGMGLNDSSSNSNSNNNDSLFQVMKAVEAAEATIKQQVEENKRLRNELQGKIQELETYKSYDSMAEKPHPMDTWNSHIRGTFERLPTVAGNIPDGVKRVGHTSLLDQPGTMVVRQDSVDNLEDSARHIYAESNPGVSKSNGELKIERDGQVPGDNNSQFSLLSSRAMASLSPKRYETEGDYDQRYHGSGHGLMPMADVNNSNSLQKQDLICKVQEQEQEIIQLRRYLADYSVKEAQIRNEKYVLEKRISHMRMAFDQQQQDLVDAASKAISYRQDIMEENIRLSYQLQAAQEERLTFVSSLMPLLAEYSLQPPVPDAQSIVCNVKVLFKHLQEQLNVVKSKLKDSQLQLAPWPWEANPSGFSLQSPAHPMSAAVTALNKNGLELVPQPAFSQVKIPVSSSTQTAPGWADLGHHQADLSGTVSRNFGPETYQPLASRSPEAHDMAGPQGSMNNTTRQSEETTKQVTFREPVSSTEMDDPDPDPDTEGSHTERGSPANWASGNSPYMAPLEDPGSSFSPYLPPVLEEPSSSFSEAADDDPLPAIDALQISGDAFPGRELQACGYSINGTTSCNFEWVRHMEDGSVNYIEGAKQPNYLVSADDVDTYLAIEVQPLDHRKRKGELVKVFANEHRKITCDPEMQNHVEKNFYNGHASYKLSLSTKYLDIWEPATLVVKREGFSIKCTGPSGIIVTEKFSPTTSVAIPYGHSTAFSIISANGVEHLLRAENSPDDVSCLRDTIVLTLRLFIIRAGEKKKGKKRGLFFSK